MADDPQGFPKLDIKAARALRPNIHQIRIDSILGGQGKITNFSRPSEFRASFGIDPSFATSPNVDLAQPAGGLINPSYYGLDYSNVSSAYEHGLPGIPLWIRDAGKTTSTFVYGANGSLYTLPSGSSTITGVSFSDGGGLSSSSGNGMEYYDNYLYLAKNTDIARFGPLNGDAILNGSYWVNTLGKSALNNTTYPTFSNVFTAFLPNHVMHRHSDGKLYFADVTNNQGVIHVISTTKTSVEGDTDNGSKYQALTFGYGLYPTAIESYGTSIVVALFETPISGGTQQFGSRAGVAKLAFWDTTSQSFNSIIFNEFPDSIITALKNINGVLYIISCSDMVHGFRVSRYVGGSSIEEVRYFEQGTAPSQGGVDGNANRLLFGSATQFPNGQVSIQRGCIYSLGLQNSALGTGMFVTGLTSTTVSSAVSAIALTGTSLAAGGQSPVMGWSNGSSHYYETPGYFPNATSSNPIWHSQVFKIGQPFKITKIRLPLSTVIDNATSIVASIYVDEQVSSPTTLTTINSTNYGFNKRIIVIRPADLTGDYSFFLELKWTATNTTYPTVALPITIEYELLDVDTTYP